MYSKSYNVLGVMSGTSLDGVDLAHVQLEFEGEKIHYKVLDAATVPYSREWEQRLRGGLELGPEEVAQLDRDYTQLLGGIIAHYLIKENITGLDAVCSHGHTILHQPHKGITLQIGNLPEIAAIVGRRVVCNFRVQDVALGGQGAPLVPVGDRLLFGDYDFCLNLGGFSNISFEDGGRRVAFDISPVNTVLNHFAQKLGHAYDDGGAIAASGTINHEMLEELDALEYYSAPYPKSLGAEFVAGVVLPLIEKFALSEADTLCTFTEHIARQVMRVVDGREGLLLVTGGGAYNRYLISRMRAMMPDIDIIVPGDAVIQFKEALVFALLGVLRLRGENNVLCSVTGAAHDHCAGIIYNPSI